MNKTLALLATTAALALSGLPTNAAVFTDVDDWTANDIVLGVNRPLVEFSDTFDITEDGYTPGTPISSAVARFTVRDENRNEGEFENFEIYLGGEYFMQAGASNFPFGNSSVALTVGGQLIATLLFDLEEDGILGYTIRATQGDFRFKSASLEATVPDGGMTVTLFGFALLGVCAVRRFAFAKSAA